ncbi:uncharacterized protein STAUR_6572 [Stigmatella aurantiaca DW4/3-1]|uniref:Uncharacterized protein n=1 Tax=Stigmatella aurantiaca (strain DW4/3-1) TaxID=378806 RepID=E3FN41_STIAD|nr:uncharacterized protein STAUR_6572 [Stigmatella aurantiaca DW4/3-1]
MLIKEKAFPEMEANPRMRTGLRRAWLVWMMRGRTTTRWSRGKPPLLSPISTTMGPWCRREGWLAQVMRTGFMLGWTAVTQQVRPCAGRLHGVHWRWISWIPMAIRFR